MTSGSESWMFLVVSAESQMGRIWPFLNAGSEVKIVSCEQREEKIRYILIWANRQTRLLRFTKLTGAGKITAGTLANCCPNSVSAVLAIPNIDRPSRGYYAVNKATMRTDNISILIFTVYHIICAPYSFGAKVAHKERRQREQCEYR